jgi:putative methyltransferase (TIGR04325 family)
LPIDGKTKAIDAELPVVSKEVRQESAVVVDGDKHRHARGSLDIIPRAMGSVRCTGDYATWAEALAASTGYYLPEFVEQTRQAALKVKQGLAAYERDSVLFDNAEDSFPLLAALRKAAAEHDGQLIVFDFGGALGSSYFRCRRLLEPLRSVRWLIVDQPQHVSIGRRDFESDELRFYETPAEVLAEHRPTVLLLSSVLPYLPAPYEQLDRLIDAPIPYVIVDRTFFLERDADRLTVQHGPFEVYPGSYPAWFFSETRLCAAITGRSYELLQSFDGFDRVAPEDEPAYSKGFIFRSSRSSR